MDNPRAIDPKLPPVGAAIATFRELVGVVGVGRVIWRYDPIILSEATPAEFHSDVHARIAAALAGCTQRNVISILDIYRKAQKRLAQLSKEGITVEDIGAGPMPAKLGELLCQLAATARTYGMEIVSCAEELDLQQYGIEPGKCVDDDYIAPRLRLTSSWEKGSNAA